MADTTYISKEVREYIWKVLADEYGQEFSRRKLGVRTGGKKSFDCVSEDGTIVAELKTSSGKTSGGRTPVGKIKSVTSDLYYLSLLDVPQRLLILTEADFYEIFTKKIQGFIPPGIEIVHMPLPENMRQIIEEIKRKASEEVGG